MNGTRHYWTDWPWRVDPSHSCLPPFLMSKMESTTDTRCIHDHQLMTLTAWKGFSLLLLCRCEPHIVRWLDRSNETKRLGRVRYSVAPYYTTSASPKYIEPLDFLYGKPLLPFFNRLKKEFSWPWRITPNQICTRISLSRFGGGGGVSVGVREGVRRHTRHFYMGVQKAQVCPFSHLWVVCACTGIPPSYGVFWWWSPFRDVWTMWRIYANVINEKDCLLVWQRDHLQYCSLFDRQ